MTSATTSPMPTQPGPPLPAIFQQVMPGQTIEDGDIIYPADGEYRLVNVLEIGTDVPDAGALIARIPLPEGHFLLNDGDVLGQKDMLWSNRADGDWWPAHATHRTGIGIITIGSIRQNMKIDGHMCFVARPWATSTDWLEVPDPPRTRKLWPGEPLRRGDLCIDPGVARWGPMLPRQSCPNPIVEMPEGQEPIRKFVRPISPDHRSWFVNMQDGQGSDANVGSVEEPFATLEGACRVIEATFARQEPPQEPLGTIWDVSGTALMAYDLPEPAPIEETAPDSDETPQFTVHDLEQHDPVVIPEHPRFKEATAHLDKQWRMLDAREEIRKGDYQFLPTSDDTSLWNWQPVEPTQITTETQDRLIRRKLPPTEPREVLQSHLATLREHLQSATELANLIQKDLDRVEPRGESD